MQESTSAELVIESQKHALFFLKTALPSEKVLTNYCFRVGVQMLFLNREMGLQISEVWHFEIKLKFVALAIVFLN